MVNNFANDTGCKTLWRLENLALTSDSIGGNILSAPAAAPTADTVNFKEGAASGSFAGANNQYLYRTDANLTADTPLKSGTTNKTISVSVWIKCASLPSVSARRAILGKWDSSVNNQRSFRIALYNNAGAGRIDLSVSSNGTAGEIFSHASDISLNTWYHVTVTYKDADKSYSIMIRDASGNVVGTDLTGTAVNNIYLSNCAYLMGAYGTDTSPSLSQTWDGLLDEMAIFDRVLSANDATAISKGTYRANNFSSDAHCKALWRFEGGVLTADSIGTNTLTNSNATSDTATRREGFGSANFLKAINARMSITDANLAAGFPLKSGDANKVITVCMWIRMASLPTVNDDGQFVYSKYTAGTSRSFGIAIWKDPADSQVKPRLLLGYNGGTGFEEHYHGSVISTATWYHLTMGYRDSDKAYIVCLRDTSGNVIGSDLSGTATLDANKLFISTQPVMISGETSLGAFFLDGKIDEIAVFDRLLSASEATDIAKGAFTAAAFKPAWAARSTLVGITQ